MPEKLERCVKQLMADPKFKPKKKGQSKRSAAYAVCTEAQKADLGYTYTFGEDADSDLTTEHCICINCGYQERRKRGTSCNEIECPDCGNFMIAKERKSISMRITKATIREGAMYWQATISDDDWDKQDERLSLQCFDDFKYRLNAQRQKADYQPPFISLAHYDRMEDGSGEIGIIDDVWTHGREFKAEGWFNDTPLGRWCFGVVKSELERMTAGEEIENPVRFSIAFYPREIAYE